MVSSNSARSSAFFCRLASRICNRSLPATLHRLWLLLYDWANTVLAGPSLCHCPLPSLTLLFYGYVPSSRQSTGYRIDCWTTKSTPNIGCGCLSLNIEPPVSSLGEWSQIRLHFNFRLTVLSFLKPFWPFVTSGQEITVPYVEPLKWLLTSLVRWFRRLTLYPFLISHLVHVWC
jgi:hypothetical protein